jgi:hypothetical protein
MPEERAAYDTAYATYTGYVRKARLRESHGPGWWEDWCAMAHGNCVAMLLQQFCKFTGLESCYDSQGMQGLTHSKPESLR